MLQGAWPRLNDHDLPCTLILDPPPQASTTQTSRSSSSHPPPRRADTPRPMTVTEDWQHQDRPISGVLSRLESSESGVSDEVKPPNPRTLNLKSQTLNPQRESYVPDEVASRHPSPLSPVCGRTR